MLRSPRVLLFTLAAAGLLTTVATAQFGLGPQPATVYRGATVFDGERFVASCDLIVVGKRITAVGPGLEAPADATVIDAAGTTIVPALIDASSQLGLVRSGSDVKPSYDVLDALDLFDRDVFVDALEQGIGYVYLAPSGRPGFGGRGRLIRLPAAGERDAEELAVDGTEALHVRLGSDPRGPIARFSQLEELKTALERAKSYQEQWEKYRKDLETYEKELAEWAAKQKSGKGGAATGEPKSGDAKPAADAAPSASPAEKRTRGPRPRPRPRAPLAFGFGFGLAGPGEPECDDAACDLTGVHDHDHDHDHDHEHDADGHDHDHDHDTTLPDPALVRLTQDEPSLSPRLSHVDDGTEPHLRRPPLPSELAAAQERFSTCPHCGTSDPWAPAHLDHRRPFEDDAFAAEAERLLVERYRDLGLLDQAVEAGLVQEPEAEPKAGEGAAAKPAADAAAKDADGRPKRPREPGFDPDSEEIVRARQGKMRVRIEVHRAEDIANLLALLEEHPLDAVLEGATEGRFLAERIAAAEIDVLTDCVPVPPLQERESRRDGSPFSRPRARDFAGGATMLSYLPAEGAASPANPAELADAGADVALSGMKPGSTPALLSVAAYAAGNGLGRERALAAVTSQAADVVGAGDTLGRIAAGRPASFTVFDGDPFAPTTRVKSVVLDGRTVLEAK